MIEIAIHPFVAGVVVGFVIALLLFGIVLMRFGRKDKEKGDKQ